MPNNTKSTSSSAGDEGGRGCVCQSSRATGKKRPFAAKLAPGLARAGSNQASAGSAAAERYFGGRVPIRRPYQRPDTATVEYGQLDSASHPSALTQISTWRVITGVLMEQTRRLTTAHASDERRVASTGRVASDATAASVANVPRAMVRERKRAADRGATPTGVAIAAPAAVDRTTPSGAAGARNAPTADPQICNTSASPYLHDTPTRSEDATSSTGAATPPPHHSWSGAHTHPHAAAASVPPAGSRSTASQGRPPSARGSSSRRCASACTVWSA